jgi:ankyrin repeat protein
VNTKVALVSCGMEKALLEVVPFEQDPEQALDSSLMDPHTRIFASPLHRNIIFSVANNFAGIGAFPKERVIELLRDESSEDLHRMIQSAPYYYTTQAIALNLFMAAIEVGDARTVDFLLNQSLPGVQANRFIFSEGDVMYTPIERAAALRHTGVVKTLLNHGADVNLSDRSKHTSKARPSGGFDCAAMGVDEEWIVARVAQIDIELFQLLVDAGGELSLGPFEALIEHDRDGKLVLSIVSKQIFRCHEQWNRDGIFLHIFRYQDHETVHQVLRLMVQTGVDLNLTVRDSYEASWLWPRCIIDGTAMRGDLGLVQGLLNFGAGMTGDTLPCAISSGNEMLVRCLLDHGAEVDKIGDLQITPLAAAIRLQSQEILHLITRQPAALQALQYSDHLRSALRAASDVEDVEWIRRLVGLGGRLHPTALGPALRNTVKDGRDAVALDLIASGADTNGDGSVLLEALRRRNAVLVRALLDADASPRYEDQVCTELAWDETSMELAVEWGDRTIVQAIISAGADVNACHDKTALSIAVERKDYDMINLLVEAGCDVNNLKARMIGRTALSAAVKTGDINVVKYVFDLGADPQDDQAFTESMGQNPALLNLLLEKHGARYPRGRRGWGAAILEKAIDAGDYELFKKLIERGADANHGVRLRGRTAFGWAIYSAERIGTRFVELLLQHKAKTNCTPETIVSQFGTDGDRNPWPRVTAIVAAIGTRHLPTVQLFLRYGANVNFPAEIGVKRTPLQRAAEVGDRKLVELLLERGADVNASPPFKGGGTALQLAALQGFIPIVRLLCEHGADVDAPASKINGRMALEGAAENGHLDLVAVLLQTGAGHHGRDQSQFQRAIALAKKNGRTYIAELLEKYLRTGKVSSGDDILEEFLDFEAL